MLAWISLWKKRRMTLEELKEKGGNGFVLTEGGFALTRCPECHKENYAMSVMSGLCAWCPFDVNAEESK